MGRHRRSDPAPGARRKHGAARIGLLGASAALTAGAVAVGTGVLADPDRFRTAEPDVQAQEDADPDTGSSSSAEQGGESDHSTSREGSRSAHPSPSEESPEKSTPETTEAPEETEDAPASEEDGTPEETAAPEGKPETGGQDGDSPNSSNSPQPPDGTQEGPSNAPEEPARQAADEVLQLANQERAAAGCAPLTHDPALATLAAEFSRDMAEGDFFSHDAPDGSTPWDRAETAGINNLGGENIARGQQSADAVLESWMSSEGHRENILNCDFRTLGVGVHLGPGGPWWTQNFGY